jgi:hypothetical protein
MHPALKTVSPDFEDYAAWLRLAREHSKQWWAAVSDDAFDAEYERLDDGSMPLALKAYHMALRMRHEYELAAEAMERRINAAPGFTSTGNPKGPAPDAAP